MATIYVRKSGNDANGGTDPDTDAKLTIASAESVASSGDTIDIGIGTWAENLVKSDITYQGFGPVERSGDFLTIIEGRFTAHNTTYNDMKFKIQSDSVFNNNITLPVNLNRVFLDGSLVSTFSAQRIYFKGGTHEWRHVSFWKINMSGSDFIVNENSGTELKLYYCNFYKANADTRFVLNWGSATIRIKNSIFHTASVPLQNLATADNGFNIRHNTTQRSDGQLNEISTADPLFKDPEGGNLNIDEGSPAFKAGIVL